jgi:hypothetical protein
MRATVIVLAVLAATGLWPSVGAALPSTPASSLSTVQDPPKAPDIDIEVNKDSGRRDARWYGDPMTIGLVVVGLVVLALIVGSVTRGSSGTTVVRQ